MDKATHEFDHLGDEIAVCNPLCVDCLKLAAGFVCWPTNLGTAATNPNAWIPKCHIHIPWNDPFALVVGIRYIDPADDVRPAAVPDPALD